MRHDVETTARDLEGLAASRQGSEASPLLVRAAQLLRELDATPPAIQPLYWTKAGQGSPWRAQSLGLAYEIADDETADYKKEQCQSDHDRRVRAVLDDGRDLVAGFAVPRGWRLVPEDPTPEMQRVGFETLGPDRECACDQYDCYRSMVAAAPQPFANSIPYDSPFSYERTSHLRDVKELRDALRPFAVAAGSIPTDLPREREDDPIHDVVPALAVTVRDVRRAAGMLEPVRPSVVRNVDDQKTAG
jgi:hypothetical protein